MTRHQVRALLLRGALSSYVRMAVRLGLGLLTFRLLFQYLSPEEFGFWSLLWSLFGYGLLLDFGFGTAAQKRVAEHAHTPDHPGLSHTLSTILCFYAVVAAVAALVGLAAAGPIVNLLGVSPANHDAFQSLLRVFLALTCVAFPFGVFPEILLGQQRVTTANLLSIASFTANFLAVAAVVHFRLPLTTLVVLTLLSIIGPNALAGWLALRRLPGVRLAPALFRRRALLETGRFGLYATLNVLGTTLRQKTDQPVLGTVLGVAAVAPYQAGGRIGEMFGLLTRQIADLLAPTAALLHARGESPALRQLLLDGLRFSTLAATPLYVATAISMTPLLRLLTGIAHPAPEMWWTGQLLLAWYYSTTLTHWVYRRIFLMAGQERRIVRQLLWEAGANLLLGILLTATFRSILGVAVGALVPTIGFGWGVLWGWNAREAGLSRTELFLRTVVPAWKACLPLLGVAAILHSLPGHANAMPTPGRSLLEFLLLGMAAVAGMAWLGLGPRERTAIRARLREVLPTPTA